MAPGINYGQTWDTAHNQLFLEPHPEKSGDTIASKGLFIDQRGSVSLGFNTAVFGTVQFKKSRIMALRHVIRPNVGFSYTPDTLIRGDKK